MDVLEAIEARRSVRTFQPEPVTQDELAKIANAGRLAPSAHNDQPWEFVIVTDMDTREQIAAATDYGKFVAESPACIVVLCAETHHYLEDGAAAVANMLIAVTGLGLSGCWIAGAGKPHAETIKKLINSPEDLKLVGMVAVGHSDESPTPHKRMLSDLVHWEKY